MVFVGYIYLFLFSIIFCKYHNFSVKIILIFNILKTFRTSVFIYSLPFLFGFGLVWET